MRDPLRIFGRSAGNRAWARQAAWAAIWLGTAAGLFWLGGPVAPLVGCATLAVGLGRGWQAWRLWRG